MKRITRGQSAISKWFSSVATGLGSWFGMGYNATDPCRNLIDARTILYANRTSANELLSSNLSALRARCRNLTRNNPTARAGVEAFAALLVGTGIALEPDTGDEETDKRIRSAWNAWIKSADVLGRDLYCIQTEAARELPQAGEALWRIVIDKSLATPENPIPARILVLEGEWLVDEVPNGGGISWVSGVKLDSYGRPETYFLRNPQTGQEEAATANQVIHIFEPKRPLQARGEPDFAPIIETMMNERDLVDAELYAAKQTAAMAMVITSENHGALDTTEDGNSDDPVQPVKLGGVARLYPGEDIKAFSHTRPSQMIAPFRQMLRGDIAAALRIPQRFLDRDVGRANYSSMRADMLDTQRLLAPLREQFGHQTAGRIYRAILPYLAIAAGVPTPRSDYRLLPDGQPYVDPVKDITAATMAITSGLSTWEEQISARGGDYQQVWAQLKKEQDLAAKLGVKIDLSGTNAPAPQSGVGAVATDPNKAKPEDDTVRKDDLERMVSAVREASRPQQFQPMQIINRSEIDADSAAAMGRAIGESMRPTVVNIPPANVTVQAARVDVPATVVNVPPTPVTIRAESAAPSVQVNVSPTPVEIENKISVESPSLRTVHARPDGKGGVIMEPQ